MTMLEYSHRISLDPRSEFGGIDERMAIVRTDASIQVLEMPNFETVYRKVYRSARVLDAIMTNETVWVLLEINKKVAIESLQVTHFGRPNRQELNIQSSDRVSRLYKLEDAVLVTGPNARASAFVTDFGSVNIPISQVASVQVFPGNLLGVTTGIYGTGSVLKFFKIVQQLERLEELAEVYLRDILTVGFL